jgi:hypothetical protein
VENRNPYGDEFDDGDDLEFEAYADNRSIAHDLEIEYDSDLCDVVGGWEALQLDRDDDWDSADDDDEGLDALDDWHIRRQDE